MTFFQKFSQKNLRNQLLQSHLALAGLGVLLLLVALGAIFWMNTIAVKVVNKTQPTMESIDQVYIQIQKSQTLLRDWMEFADPRFVEQRRAVWTEKIYPSLARFQALIFSDSKEIQNLLNEIKDHLVQYQMLQDQIEGLAHSEENEPARYLFEHEVAPLSKRLNHNIDLMLSEERKRAGGKDTLISSTLLDFSHYFVYGWSILDAYLHDARPAKEEMFKQSIEIIESYLSRLQKFSLTQRQRVALRRVKKDFAAYKLAAKGAMFNRVQPSWNRTFQLITKVHRPLDEALENRLQALTDIMTQRMQADRKTVVQIGWLAKASGVFLIGLMILLATLLSLRSAKKIALPIMELTQAARRFAAGDLQESLPEKGEGEVTDLTEAFNRMRLS